MAEQQDPEETGFPEDFDPEEYVNDGLRPPVFASREVKALQQELDDRKAYLTVCQDKIDSADERVKIMTAHLNSVHHELKHTQQLVDAKRKDHETEEHIAKTTSMKFGRIMTELERLDDSIAEGADRTNTMQNDIALKNEQLDQFKLEMNWKQEELQQWALAARQKEEDEIAIERYRRQDDQKIRDLSFAIEKLTVETNKKRQILEDEVTETQSKQIELDRTAQQFQALHAERKSIVASWEHTVADMQKRDQHLAKQGDMYGEKAMEINKKREKLADHQKLLQETIDEMERSKAEISSSDRELAQLRLKHMHSKDGMQELRDEVEVIKNQVASSASGQSNRRNGLASIVQETEDRKKKYNDLSKLLAATKKRLSDEQNAKKSEEDHAQEAEDDYKNIMVAYGDKEKQMKEVKDEIYRESQELYRLRGDESNALGEISGAQSAIKNLTANISKLDGERQRQQELLYSVDFQSQLMQRKVARVSGERTVEEKEQSNKKLELMEKEYAQTKELNTVLNNQSRRQTAELQQARRNFKNLEAEIQKQQAVSDELNLECDIMNRASDSSTRAKEEVLVHHDVMKLEYNRLRATVVDKLQKTIAIENRKAQLNITMVERQSEIQVHKNAIASAVRVADEERHKVMSELNERQHRVKTLKTKHDIVKSRSGNAEGEQHSQAYFVLKAAQAKEEMQRKGDNLNGQIVHAEREVTALSNTLKHLIERNTNYKASFQNAGADADQATSEKRDWEKKARALTEDGHKKRGDKERVQKEFDEDHARKQEMDAMKNELENIIKHHSSLRENNENELQGTEHSLEQNKEPLKKAMVAAVNAGHSGGGVEGAPTTLADMELQVAAVDADNEALMLGFWSMMEHDFANTAVQDAAIQLCHEVGLQIPDTSVVR